MTSQRNDPDIRLTFDSILESALESAASDIHITAGESPWIRIQGVLAPCTSRFPAVTPDLMLQILGELLDDSARQRLEERGSVDGAFARLESRFRFNVFRSGGRDSLSIRLLENRFRSLDELGLNDDLYRICDLRDGLVLVAGPTGSGKSTTLATMIDRINSSRQGHIVTIEDPVEYLHGNRRSLVSQRQIGLDTIDFSQALVDAVRQDPDVILVGELRDLLTIRTAVMAAETGHLVLASVHAGDGVGAIERVISVFPAEEQSMVRQLLSTTLRAVITQHLLVALDRDADAPGNDPRPSRNRVLASEVLIVNKAVSNLIATGELVQIRTVLETSRADGMYTLDQSLSDLVRKRMISPAVARSLARNPATLEQRSRPVLHALR